MHTIAVTIPLTTSWEHIVSHGDSSFVTFSPLFLSVSVSVPVLVPVHASVYFLVTVHTPVCPIPCSSPFSLFLSLPLSPSASRRQTAEMNSVFSPAGEAWCIWGSFNTSSLHNTLMASSQGPSRQRHTTLWLFLLWLMPQQIPLSHPLSLFISLFLSFPPSPLLPSITHSYHLFQPLLPLWLHTDLHIPLFPSFRFSSFSPSLQPTFPTSINFFKRSFQNTKPNNANTKGSN